MKVRSDYVSNSSSSSFVLVTDLKPYDFVKKMMKSFGSDWNYKTVHNFQQEDTIYENLMNRTILTICNFYGSFWDEDCTKLPFEYDIIDGLSINNDKLHLVFDDKKQVLFKNIKEVLYSLDREIWDTTLNSFNGFGQSGTINQYSINFMKAIEAFVESYGSESETSKFNPSLRTMKDVIKIAEKYLKDGHNQYFLTYCWSGMDPDDGCLLVGDPSFKVEEELVKSGLGIAFY